MSSDEEDWTSVPAKKAKQPADKKTKLYGAEAIAESGERITGKVPNFLVCEQIVHLVCAFRLGNGWGQLQLCLAS